MLQMIRIDLNRSLSSLKINMLQGENFKITFGSRNDHVELNYVYSDKERVPVVSEYCFRHHTVSFR
jgi:hypothetical protein